jgi:hypothetical protein
MWAVKLGTRFDEIFYFEYSKQETAFPEGSLIFISKKRQCMWTIAGHSVTIAKLARD